MSLEVYKTQLQQVREDIERCDLKSLKGVEQLMKCVHAFCEEYSQEIIAVVRGDKKEPKKYIDNLLSYTANESIVLTLCETIVKRIERLFPEIEDNSILESYLIATLGNESEKGEDGGKNLINISNYLESEITILLGMYFGDIVVEKLRPVYGVFERHVKELFEYFTHVSLINSLQQKVNGYIFERKITAEKVSEISIEIYKTLGDGLLKAIKEQHQGVGIGVEGGGILFLQYTERPKKDVIWNIAFILYVQKIVERIEHEIQTNNPVLHFPKK